MDRKTLIENAIPKIEAAYAVAAGIKSWEGMIMAARLLLEASRELGESKRDAQVLAAPPPTVSWACGCGGSPASTSALYSTSMQLCPCGDLCPCHIPKDVLGDGSV